MADNRHDDDHAMENNATIAASSSETMDGSVDRNHGDEKVSNNCTFSYLVHFFFRDVGWFF